MISYDPLWKTLKEKNISSYKLIHKHGLSHGTFDNLKHNRNVTMQTIDQLCKMLHCRIEDIAVYIEDTE